jgi:tRNA U55 pseudouridine synthase TruB
MPLDQAAAELPRVRLTAAAAARVSFGRAPAPADVVETDAAPPGETVRLVDDAGRLLALAVAPSAAGAEFALLRVFGVGA